MKLGDNVTYTDSNENEILATIQAKLESGKVIISLPGGNTLEVDKSELSELADI